MIRTSKIFVVVTCCMVLLVGGSAHAGVLNGNPLAYMGFSGTSPFVNNGLSGTVDWAVFTANVFNNSPVLNTSGYVAPAGQLVYAHQIFTNNPAGNDVDTLVGATGMTIALAGNPAGLGGSFTGTGISGVDLDSAFVDPTIADFSLVAETDALTPSDGLVYSSTNIPQVTGTVIVVDGVSAAGALPIGIPGPNQIPEPATWLITSLATVLMFAFRRGRRA